MSSTAFQRVRPAVRRSEKRSAGWSSERSFLGSEVGVAAVGDREEHGLEARAAGVEIVELDLVVRGPGQQVGQRALQRVGLAAVVRPCSCDDAADAGEVVGQRRATVAKLIVDGMAPPRSRSASPTGRSGRRA